MKIVCQVFILFCLLLPLTGTAQQADTVKSILKDTTQLDEIIISAKTAVRVSGDTVSYTVDSFYKDPNATAEDVLKRLPGVEVARDGKITIQGKEVTKIFINGKEYQAEDLRTVTQNLPAEILEKIQVADWYDEETQFTGIRKGTQQKSINLQFKKQYQHGIYGRAATGYGTKKRYQEGIFASYMGGDMRMNLIGNMNNTGIADATNDAGADNARSANIPGTVQKQQANLNFSYDRIKNLKLTGLYELSADHTELQQGLLRTTYLPGDSSLVRLQSSAQANTGIQHRFSLRSQYRVNEKLNMTTSIMASLRNTESANNSLDQNSYNSLYPISFQRLSSAQTTTASPNARIYNTLQKSFNKKGRTLSLNLQANITNNSTEGLNNNQNIYDSAQPVSFSNFETDETKTNLNTRVNVKYTEPISERSTLSFDYSNLYTSGDNERQVWQVNNGSRNYDTVQSRSYKNLNMENPFGLLYQYRTDDLTAGAGVDIQAYNRQSNTVNSTNNSISQKGINYFPNLFTRYAITSKANLNVNYSGSIISPDINQLQPIPDYTDSLNIFIGNPNLRPELNNNITLSYNFFDAKQKTFWATIRGNWTNNKIINSVNINASKKITTPINANGVYNLGGSLSYTQPLFSKKLKASISMNGNLSRNITLTNNLLQAVTNYNYQPSLKLIFTSISWYEGDINYNYRFNNISSATTQTPTLLQTHNISGSGTFFLPAGFKLGYALAYIVNTGLSKGLEQDFLQVNLRADKTFKNIRGLSARIQAFDILNNYPNVQRTVGDNYYEDRTFNRLGSYYMLSIIYRFSWFPASRQDEEGNMRDDE